MAKCRRAEGQEGAVRSTFGALIRRGQNRGSSRERNQGQCYRDPVLAWPDQCPCHRRDAYPGRRRGQKGRGAMDASKLLKPASRVASCIASDATTLDEIVSHVGRTRRWRGASTIFVSEAHGRGNHLHFERAEGEIRAHHGCSIAKRRSSRRQCLSNATSRPAYPRQWPSTRDGGMHRGLRMQIDSKPEALDELRPGQIQIRSKGGSKRNPTIHPRIALDKLEKRYSPI